jgi:hypothetical protein
MRLLLDTTVLIDFLRDQPKAIAYLNGLESKPCISAITVAELFAGVREGIERQALERMLDGLDIISVDGPIAERGGLHVRKFGPSHGTKLADALIAACAEAAHADLVTGNTKHFPMLANVVLPY